MKTADAKTVQLPKPCTGDPFLSEMSKRRGAAFIEIYMDQGPMGIRETHAGYFIPEAVPQLVDSFKPIPINRSVDNIRISGDMPNSRGQSERGLPGAIVLPLRTNGAYFLRMTVSTTGNPMRRLSANWTSL